VRADVWHGDQVPQAGPIGFAHGSHVESGKRFRPVAPPRGQRRVRPPEHHNGSRHHFTEGEAPRGHRYRSDPDDDPTGYGRHSSSK
jgi:hypothetical protein